MKPKGGAKDAYMIVGVLRLPSDVGSEPRATAGTGEPFTP